MNNPFKGMNPFQQNSKSLFFTFLVRVILIIVFFLIVAFVCFAQDAATDENGLTPVFDGGTISVSNILGKWYDHSGIGTTAEFFSDGTSVWTRGEQYWPFTYKITGDVLIFTSSKSGAVTICRIDYLGNGRLWITEGEADHPTYTFEQE